MTNAIDMTTLADVKAWLNIPTIVTQDDALLSSYITRASDFLQQWLSRDIVTTLYTADTYNGNGNGSISVKNWPIQSIASIVIYGADMVTTTTYTKAGTDFLFDDQAIYLTNGNKFTKGVKNVYITYTAGYATVPFILQQATIEFVAHKYKERDRIGLASKGLAGETTAFITADMPATVRTALTQFRNVVPLG